MNFLYKLPKKYIVKVPKNISVIYSESQKIIILIGPFGKRVLKLKTKIFLHSLKNKIFVSKIPFLKMSIYRAKKITIFQGISISLLKQSIIEISITIYQKLKLVGVGYRVFLFNLLSFQVLHLRLGYSHQIYLKLDSRIKFFCFKTTIFFILGHSYSLVMGTASNVRSYKIPEIYKGKGILYENETVVLKKGKKV